MPREPFSLDNYMVYLPNYSIATTWWSNVAKLQAVNDYARYW